MEDSEAVIVSDVSMQEWAMLAFEAKRAPRRVAIRVVREERTQDLVETSRVGCARTTFWLLLAAAMSSTLPFL